MSEISEDRADDPSLEALLSRIERHVVRFDPATASHLSQCSQELSKQSGVSLAADHMALLRLTNGMLWNGIQLYGTQAIPRPHRHYTLPSLVDANITLPRSLKPGQQIIIGRTEDEWLVMAQRPDRIIYQEVDCIDGDVYRQAASIRRLLTRLIKERMPR